MDGWPRPTEPPTIRSEVIGDFHEPYGAISIWFANLLSFLTLPADRTYLIDPSFSIEVGPARVSLPRGLVADLPWLGIRHEGLRETFVTTSKRLYKTYATLAADCRVSMAQSLILLWRTEIKARALVLGEVSALSFCLQTMSEFGLTPTKS